MVNVHLWPRLRKMIFRSLLNASVYFLFEILSSYCENLLYYVNVYLWQLDHGFEYFHA